MKEPKKKYERKKISPYRTPSSKEEEEEGEERYEKVITTEFFGVGANEVRVDSKWNDLKIGRMKKNNCDRISSKNSRPNCLLGLL